MHRHALVAQVFAHFADDLGKLLHGVLHEVDLGVVVLLNSIQFGAVVIADQLDTVIECHDIGSVLCLSLLTGYLDPGYLWSSH